MPAHSNKVRMDFNMPVFDISTVGQCAMSAAETFSAAGADDVIAALFRNAAFGTCMSRMFDPNFIEPKFGTQKDGTLLYYDGLPQVPAPYPALVSRSSSRHRRATRAAGCARVAHLHRGPSTSPRQAPRPADGKL